jgi:hypothetical protein
MSIILDGTNGIAAANVFGRNIIINGDGRINQRGYVSGTATTGANQYTLDRWRVVTSGQNLAFTGNDAGREMTAPAGGVEQVIEDKNIAGGTYVINWEGTATATVGGNAVTKGGTFTLTANTNATLRMIDGTFKNVQIEQGSVATPFERRPFGTELALCQRYYYKTQATTTGHQFSLGQGNATNSYVSGIIYFPVEMRAPPTALEQTGTASDYTVRIEPSTTSVCSSVPTFVNSNNSISFFRFTVASGLTSNNCYSMRAANTNAFLAWSAEL